jgi:hypothetical protein
MRLWKTTKKRGRVIVRVQRKWNRYNVKMVLSAYKGKGYMVL